MYVIIAGGGTVGFELVQELVRTKHEIVVIDLDKENCDELFAAFGVETIFGNATRVSVLMAAGIERADAVVATMRSDADNLALSVLAKSHAVPEIIVRMYKRSYLDAYRTAGVTLVMNEIDALIRDVVYQIDKPKVKPIARLGEGAVELFLVRIGEKAKIIGKTISEIASDKRLPQQSIIAGIYEIEGNEFKIPRGNTKIMGETELFVITKPDLVPQTARYLMRS